jgi:hypothetical protein
MALDGYVSDLETGDRLRPVRYRMSPFVVREYCHGVGEFREEFHAATPGGEQVAPPTLVHIDKIRLIQRSCPLGPGPNARIHYQFKSKHHRPIPVGADLAASGVVGARYEKKGRVYLDIDIELRDAHSDELIIEYHDTAILSYAKRERGERRS